MTLTRPKDLSVYIRNILVSPIVADEKSSPAKGTPKKMKVEAYKLSKEQKALIKDDELNKKFWDEAMQSLSLGPVRTRYLACLLSFWEDYCESDVFISHCSAS